MEFNEVIKIRRSCREFSSRKISKKDILELLEAARLAPSAKNRQPWNFVILEGKKKNKIADIMESDLTNKDILEVNKPTNEDFVVASIVNSVRVIKEAPLLILVFRDNDEDWIEGDYLSIGCTVEHIHLAATNKGLGSLWIRDSRDKRKKIKKELNKEKLDLVTGIVIGYSIEERWQCKKKSLEEIVEWL